MNDIIRIKVLDEYETFIDYLVYHGIYFKNLIKNNNYYTLNISYKDYKSISRRYKTTIIYYYGRRGLIEYIKHNKYMLISFLISLIMLNNLSNTIFDIRINTDDNEIKKIILNSLKDNGISLYKKKKSFDEIYLIKEKILKNNRDSLEWLEINEKGCIYEINLTKRVKESLESSDNVSSIYAKKDGLIKHISISSGVAKVEINDYVKKGDVLISGNVIKDDELVKQVKSEGKVFAEVWYIVKVNIPFNYIEYTKTGNVINRYYLDINGKEFTLIGKYDSNNTISSKKTIVDKPYLFFKVIQEIKTEYEYKEYNIDENEAYIEALRRSEKHIRNRLGDDEYIISKKVLKKVSNSSKMYVEVFFKVYENIGLTSNIDEKGEKDEFTISN